jgi:hypothetical protein
MPSRVTVTVTASTLFSWVRLGGLRMRIASPRAPGFAWEAT